MIDMRDRHDEQRPLNGSPHRLASTLQRLILDLIPRAFGSTETGWLRCLCGWLFALPTGRFARYFAAADREIGRTGMSGGCRRLLSDLSVGLLARGTEHLPTQYPLLVASNHPGAYDAVALASCIPRRDCKILV